MPVEVKLKPEEKFTADDLVQVFKKFCSAYRVIFLDSDENYLKKSMQRLEKNPFGFEYEIGFAKFSAQRSGDTLRFGGYRQEKDREQEPNDRKFAEMVREYFGGRID